jgi:hypothetical protein
MNLETWIIVAMLLFAVAIIAIPVMFGAYLVPRLMGF